MTKQVFQLISNNRGWFKPPTLELRTTEMPKFADLGYKYESCLFTESSSNVVGRYDTLSEAVKNHERLCQKYGLKS